MQKQILIVEDNEINRMILSEILSDSYIVHQAENGKEALDILQQHKNNIALILLDVEMPVMDGYTFLDHIKEDPDYSTIPVIVTTQSDSEENEVCALSHGATDFVPKPYRPQVILHRVASLIKLRENAAIINQFQYDRLTGLYSKEYFYHKLREILDTDTEHEYTIVCSDFENFKLYNDTYGRAAGDRLLIETTNIMKVMVANDGGICGRYGADCFLSCITRENELKARESFFSSEIDPHQGKLQNIVMKWGIYEITDRSIAVELMCDRARLAAKSVKGQYNQYYAVYDDNLRSKLLREKAITDEMETALEENKFVIYYQPKIRLSDCCMVGAEALVRWIHPELGFISPGLFIPLFEQNGFISKLDQYMWKQVCIQLSEWKKQGYELIPVSVNVSRSDVYQTNLVEFLSNLVKEYDIDPKYLHLEITESAYAENPSLIISTVSELRKKGFVIEMDDFGSGYSSLNMLSQMSIDILKLDMKFIQGEINKPRNQSLLKDVIQMAHRLHLSVVAEGVETKEQVLRLQEEECDYVQGFYFAKPMPVSQFEELWKIHKPKQGIFYTGYNTENTGLPCMYIIDESKQYLDNLKNVFDSKYNVICINDTDATLKALNTENAGNISIILLSMTMPQMGEAKILKVLKQNPAYSKTPVISILPEGGDPNSIPLCMETDEFYCKSHPIEALSRRVNRLKHQHETTKRESELVNQANRDQLTNLLNRRGLYAAMSSLRKEDLPLAVYLFDLDNLKTINDAYGHDFGDQMIHAFADLISCKTRSGDILCRYGGDEFVILLKRISDENTALKKGNEICNAFSSCLSDAPFHASCSAGIAFCQANVLPSVELIGRADKALYCAKHKTKGACSLYSEEQ